MPNNLSPRERLLRTLARQPVDRPPVLCTGGSMMAAVRELIGADAPLPVAHTDPTLLAELCTRIQQRTGFENLRTPLCATIEAEALGSLVDLGTAAREPTLTHEVFPNLAAVCLPPVEVLLKRGRVPVRCRSVGMPARGPTTGLPDPPCRRTSESARV